MIAVIECRNRADNVPSLIEVFYDTLQSREKARRRYLELVSECISDIEEVEEDEAKKRAEKTLSPHGSQYEVGDGYIAMIESGVILHE